MARIMFIDDDVITLEILGKATEILGHQPILLNAGRNAIDRVGELKPDMIMMDMMMPDMDGMAMLACLREQAKTAAIPVVILSAGKTPDDNQQVIDAGAQAYISKPISLVKLQDTIQRYTHI
ncbi:MAG TPA: response regulator [Anaerolineaceae bacterium]|nr:response regulator [Anaerolineaceae bacterium]